MCVRFVDSLRVVLRSAQSVVEHLSISQINSTVLKYEKLSPAPKHADHNMYNF